MTKRFHANSLTRYLIITTLCLAAIYANAQRAETQPTTQPASRLWVPSVKANELIVLRGHTSNVWTAAFSGDGSRVVTASADKTARIWDAATGKELAVLKGHGHQVRYAAFSPDGRRIVTTSEDNTTRVWNTESGEELAVTKGRAAFALFNPDGKRVLLANDSTIRIWDADTGNELVLLEKQVLAVRTAAFSPDGKRVVVASLWTTYICDAESGKELTVFKNDDRTYFDASAAFSPDGKRVVTTTYTFVSQTVTTYAARVWDVETGKELESMPLVAGVNDVISTTFSPDGKHILAVTRPYSRTVHIWDGRSGRELIFLPTRSWRTNTATFSSDGSRIVTASENNTATIWDVASIHERGADGNLPAQVADAGHVVLRGHTHFVHDAAFSPDGRRVVTASEDGTARVWDVATGKEQAVLKGHTRRATTASFSPDGTRIVTAAGDGGLFLWDAEGKQATALGGHGNRINTAVFSADGQRLVTAAGDGAARVWDVATGKKLAELRGHADLHITSAAFSPDGKRIVTASYDKTARIWDIERGEVLTVLRGHTNAVHSAVFSPDGKRVATTSSRLDGAVRIWDAESGKELAALKQDGFVTAAAFSPDGKRLATVSYNTHQSACLWDVESGREIAELEHGYGGVSAVAFSHDGRYVLTGGEDSTTRLWDGITGKPLALMTQYDWNDTFGYSTAGRIRTARFNADATLIVTASEDGTACLWDVAAALKRGIPQQPAGPEAERE